MTEIELKDFLLKESEKSIDESKIKVVLWDCLVSRIIGKEDKTNKQLAPYEKFTEEIINQLPLYSVYNFIKDTGLDLLDFIDYYKKD